LTINSCDIKHKTIVTLNIGDNKHKTMVTLNSGDIKHKTIVTLNRGDIKHKTMVTLNTINWAVRGVAIMGDSGEQCQNTVPIKLCNMICLNQTICISYRERRNTIYTYQVLEGLNKVHNDLI